jgi:phospholipid/cholesterol/gamma-HCH transport system ATP-binding protein
MDTLVQVQDLTLAHGDRVIQRALTFDVRQGEVLAVIGGSGSGKSTLLRHLVGLDRPLHGRVTIAGTDLGRADDTALATLRRRFGVMFQAGALWSSMTVGENVMLPLEMFTPMPAQARRDTARARLQQVGLDHAFDLDPAALSGGMRKRAAIARAMVLDPPLLFLDEPSAGLDPPTSTRLDELIAQLRDDEGTTIVLVTHELDSIFAVADRALFLDAEARTMTALGPPRDLREHGPEAVRRFLTSALERA